MIGFALVQSISPGSVPQSTLQQGLIATSGHRGGGWYDRLWLLIQKLVGQSDCARADGETTHRVSSPPINRSHGRVPAHPIHILLLSLATMSAWQPRPASHHAKDRPSPSPALPVSVPLRADHHSSQRWITTKNEGTNRTARQVEAIIPLKTASPMDLRALAPAPVASTSGSTPRMKANDVMGIGRNLVRAASTSNRHKPRRRVQRQRSLKRKPNMPDSANCN